MELEDNVSECSISRERKHFVKKLKTNPLFLLQHFPSLFSVVWQRYRRRRNRKTRPSWLPATLKRVAHSDYHAIWQNIPERSPKCALDAVDAVDAVIPHAMTITAIDNDNDHEDYLAKHRFGELLQLSATANNHSYTLPNHIYQWLRNPPPKHDLAWETYSACERVANLLTWISWIPRSLRARVLPHNIAPFLEDSLYWIDNHLEYYRHNTNNHILNNARALVMCGVALNHRQAVERGVDIFKQMLPILIQPQGALRERSTHYQLIVLNWLLDAYFFIDFMDDDANIKTNFIADVINRMRAVAALFCDDNGFLQVYIGDISPDATPLMTALRLRNCYPAFWPKKIDEAELQSWAAITHYDDYYVLHKNHHRVILNCTHTIPQSHPSHGHNDLTSFVWLYAGEPILIDSGRARYRKDRIANQQKSARAHNLALVNDFPPCAESLVIQGHWWPCPYAKTAITIDYHPHQPRVSISHNGFKRATPVLNHTRTISIDDDNNHLCIEDDFFGDKNSHCNDKVDIIILWQLHSSLRKIINDDDDHDGDELTLTNDNINLILATNAEKISFTQLGWHSTQYGEVKRHPVLILKWTVQLPFTAKTRFKVEPICVV